MMNIALITLNDFKKQNKQAENKTCLFFQLFEIISNTHFKSIMLEVLSYYSPSIYVARLYLPTDISQNKTFKIMGNENKTNAVFNNNNVLFFFLSYSFSDSAKTRHLI